MMRTTRKPYILLPLIFASLGAGLWIGGCASPAPEAQVHERACVEDEVRLDGRCATIDDIEAGPVHDAAASMRRYCPYPKDDAIILLERDDIIGQCMPRSGMRKG